MSIPPSTPLPELSRWRDRLAEIARRPLEYCPHFQQLARLHEAWWTQQNERPLFLAVANPDPSRPITKRLDLLDKPEAWLAAKRADSRQMRFFGDTIPFIRVDFGPAMLGGLFGGRVEFGSDTTWTHAQIDDDWSNEPDWQLREDNPFWRSLQTLLRVAAADAKGRYVICMPDLGGSADVLLNLRGSTGLCLDALERPDRVRAAIDAMYPAWRRAYCELYRQTVDQGVGLISWLLLWSNRPYMPAACDFNFMIGPDEFNALCLPDIARQTATVGRGCFHLDGVGAAKHIDALLEVPEIRGIQFVPGAGSPSALIWVEMFRKILASGRSVLAVCPPEEVKPLCEALPHAGLAVWPDGTFEALENAYADFQRSYG
jgi:hypothetical protein